jgi:hypothetical protein
MSRAMKIRRIRIGMRKWFMKARQRRRARMRKRMVWMVSWCIVVCYVGCFCMEEIKGLAVMN